MQVLERARDASCRCLRLMAYGALVGAVTAGAANAAGCNAHENSPGVSATEIKLGSLMPLSGSAAAGGIGARAGAQAYFDILNAAGGIKGHKIIYKVLDDQYTPSVAQQQIRTLIQRDHVFLIAGGEGTPNFLATVPFIERFGVPAIAPYAPSSELGSMKTPHVFMTAISYITEFDVMTDYAVKNFKPTSLGLVGVQGNVGDNAKAGMEAAVKGTGIKVSYIPEVPGTADMTPIATQLRDANASWVFLILTNADTGQLLEAMARIGYTPRTAAWAGMDDENYIKAFGKLSQGMIIAEETAKLNSTDPLVRKFVRDYTKNVGKAPDKFQELGWVQAEIVGQALSTATALTRSCVMEALENMKNFNTGILPPVSFGPDVRQGVNAVGLVKLEGGSTTEVLPFTSVQ
jgi:branched-chain amino acid transport system substrate-binding protein